MERVTLALAVSSKPYGFEKHGGRQKSGSLIAVNEGVVFHDPEGVARGELKEGWLPQARLQKPLVSHSGAPPIRKAANG